MKLAFAVREGGYFFVESFDLIVENGLLHGVF